MIECNDLRLGNLVWAEDETLFMTTTAKIELISKNGAEWVSIEKCSFGYTQSDNDRDLEPIELTEEWLRKFEFEELDWDSKWQKGTLQLDTDDDITFYLLIACTRVGIKIEYIHQLQNLYLDLTGKRLEIAQPI